MTTRARTLGAWLLVATLVGGGAAAPLAGQLRISGQVDLVAHGGTDGSDARPVNRNFRGDDPFNEVQARLFAQHWVTDRIGVFAEAFFDKRAGPRLNGAYLVVNELAGREWLSLRAGLAPSLIGNFGLRSTYFNSNPLIGVPLIWQYRTTLEGSGTDAPQDLRRRLAENSVGIPMLYDACWNLQWELMGSRGIFEYSLGVTPGSMSNPNGALEAEGVQWLGRLGVEPTTGLRLGVSGGIGPYIGAVGQDAAGTAPDVPGGPTAYDQKLAGVDLEWARGKVHLFSEGYVSSWETPSVPESLVARGGYVEMRYDFLPRWFGAARVGGLAFNDIDPGVAGAPRTGWDDDVLRIESALTYRWAREVHLRLNWQRTAFLTGPDDPIHLIALQLQAVF